MDSKEPRISASSASFTAGEAGPVVTAAVDKGASGGPVFNRNGALVGLVAPSAGEPKRIAGLALAAPHALIAPDALRAFLGGGKSATENDGPLSAGEIVDRERRALVAVFCQE